MIRKLFFLTIIFFTGISFCDAQEISVEKALKHLQILSSDSLEGRQTGTAGNLAARKYIIDQFSKMGLAAYFPDYVHKFSFIEGENSINGLNVVGFIEGEYPSTIVISAHYDHIGKIDSIVFNGADDNASGVAALLEIADYFTRNQPKNTLIFCAFDAEEYGFQGARAFLKSSAVNTTEIIMNVNMDMISRSEKGKLFAVGTSFYPYFKKYLPLGKTGDFQLSTGHDQSLDSRQSWVNSSDHAEFFKKKIPFIYFGVDDHVDYHKPTDTFENIQPLFYSFAINSILESIINLDLVLSNETEE